VKNPYIIFTAMGTELVGIILATLWIGQKLDEIYGLKGLAMISLSLIGLIGWLIQIVFLLKKLEKMDS
jgi:F0F1-type ATP synthase assembly protein I